MLERQQILLVDRSSNFFDLSHQFKDGEWSNFSQRWTTAQGALIEIITYQNFDILLQLLLLFTASSVFSVEMLLE